MNQEEKPTVISEEELKAKASVELMQVKDMEMQLSELEMALSNDPTFQNFLNLQKAVADKSKEVLKNLEKQMIENNVKSIKLNDWGTLTIVDGKKWSYDETVLPKKFIKKVVDTTAINNQLKLTGKVPKGATFVPNYYIKATPKKDK